MYRYLKITSPNRSNTNYLKIHKYYKEQIKEAHKRLLKIQNVIKNPSNSKAPAKFKLELIGLDGTIKKQFNKITKSTLPTIFKLIDEMPLGYLRPSSNLTKKSIRSNKTIRSNINKTNKTKKIKGLSLYSDYNPKTTLKETGFKDAETAKHTIKLIKNRDLTYQKRVIQTMYNRAKYHPYQTKQMKEAMKIFKSWLNKH